MEKGAAVKIVVDKPAGVDRVTKNMLGVIYDVDNGCADIIHLDGSSYWYRWNHFYQYSAAEEALLRGGIRDCLNHIRREYGL